MYTVHSRAVQQGRAESSRASESESEAVVKQHVLAVKLYFSASNSDSLGFDSHSILLPKPVFVNIPKVQSFSKSPDITMSPAYVTYLIISIKHLQREGNIVTELN